MIPLELGNAAFNIIHWDYYSASPDHAFLDKPNIIILIGDPVFGSWLHHNIIHPRHRLLTNLDDKDARNTQCL